jgi:DNA-binding IclR family transcriptional regulator
VGSSVEPVGVLDKAASILVALEAGPRPLTDLAAESGLPRATAHRLAVQLEGHGLVRRDPEGRFLLGARLIALGRAAADAFPLRAVALPVLERLRDETGESAQLYVAEAGGRRCVVSLPSPHALRWIVAEGALLPMERGSAGKVLGGAASRDWAQSVEEREPGVASVSAAVRPDGGPPIAAVSVSGPIERLTRQPGRRFGRRVVAAAREIEVALRGEAVAVSRPVAPTVGV